MRRSFRQPGVVGNGQFDRTRRHTPCVACEASVNTSESIANEAKGVKGVEGVKRRISLGREEEAIGRLLAGRRDRLDTRRPKWRWTNQGGCKGIRTW